MSTPESVAQIYPIEWPDYRRSRDSRLGLRDIYEGRCYTMAFLIQGSLIENAAAGLVVVSDFSYDYGERNNDKLRMMLRFCDVDGNQLPDEYVGHIEEKDDMWYPDKPKGFGIKHPGEDTGLSGPVKEGYFYVPKSAEDEINEVSASLALPESETRETGLLIPV